MARGIPVPPVIPEGSKAFVICVPDDPFFYGVVMGAIKVMTFNYYWQGSAEQIEAVTDRMKTMYYDYQEQNDCLCDEVAECIEGSEAVQNALAQWFSDAVDNNTIVQQALQRSFDPGKGGSQIPDEYAQQNQYGAALGCDMDDGWGHIRSGLIDRSFQRVQDVLERIEFVTDNQEMLAEFLNAIPGVGAFFDVIPVTDWVLWFDNVRATLKEAFEAGDTTDLRDQIACDLFCIWQLNCSLSVDQIRQYYWQKTVDILPSWNGAFDSFVALGNALSELTSVSVPEQAVYALVGSQYGFLTYLNDWFGVHINATANDLALGEPSDDWEAICDDCPENWTFVIDFVTGENVSFVDIVLGTYTPGVGLATEYIDGGGAANSYTVLAFNWTTLPENELRAYEVECEYTAGIIADTGDALFYLKWGDGVIGNIVEPTIPTFPQTWEGTQPGGAAPAQGIGIISGATLAGGGNPGGSALLTKITLSGFGTAPV